MEMNQNAALQNGVMVQAMMTRQAKEVEGAIFMAKQYPRDEEAALRKILKACERKSLAEKATYAYEKGKKDNGDTNIVDGPSIRLAEVLSLNWTNIDAGVIELEQRQGESVCMAYAWDLEANCRDTKTFTVKHERKARNVVYKLTDSRDIYEVVANNGARRKRACILAVIPGDIIEAAIVKCKETILRDVRPLMERIGELIEAFKDFSVTKEMVQKRFTGKKINEKEYLELLGIYNSLKDNMSKPSDYFEFVGQSVGEGTAPAANVNEKLQAKVAEKTNGGTGNGTLFNQ